MKIKEWLKENPRITGQITTGILSVVGAVATYLQSNPDVIPEISQAIGLSPDMTGIITVIFVTLFGGFSQARINYKTNENKELKEELKVQEEDPSIMGSIDLSPEYLVEPEDILIDEDLPTDEEGV